MIWVTFEVVVLSVPLSGVKHKRMAVGTGRRKGDSEKGSFWLYYDPNQANFQNYPRSPSPTNARHVSGRNFYPYLELNQASDNEE